MAGKNTETAAEAETTAATTEASAADGRAIVIKVPANAAHPYTAETFKEALAGETKQQPRAEFIREYANTGKYSRSELTVFTRLASGLEANDKKLKYQIIFQATKTLPKSIWPQKVEEAPAAEEATAEA